MDPLILFSILLSVILGVLRGADLAWGTDPVTGLCVVGSVWWRYLLLAAVVLAAVLTGRSRGKDPAALCTRKPGGAAAAFAAAVIDKVVSDEPLRNHVIDLQNNRLQDYGYFAVRRKFEGYLKAFLQKENQ